MQLRFVENKKIEKEIRFLTGNGEVLEALAKANSLEPFSTDVIHFLNEVSGELLADREAKRYPDIITYAFWIRKASVQRYKERFCGNPKENEVCLGRGTVFHIAPSNVPVNYAYSLAAGLLTGNKNIVRVSSKEFRQVDIINRAINKVLKNYENLKPYMILVKYPHSREVSDYFSALSDVRVIWGGDHTIEEIRKSPLPARSGEITFADRYSMAVIDSDYYLEEVNADRAAQSFYNDTYMTDQNACTSPRIVIWTGNSIPQAKEIFWEHLYQIVDKKYEIQPVQAVDKLTNMYLAAAGCACRQIKGFDNRLVRVKIDELTPYILDYVGNSGFFYEYDCGDILEIKGIVNDKCQTIGYIGRKEMFRPILEGGLKGIDRIVPVGKTMDFDFIWDGYNLFAEMTRVISLV